MKEFIKSSLFFKHLFAALAVMSIVIWCTFKFINSYTLHGNAIHVPNVKNFPLNKAIETIEKSELRYRVVDSVFVDDKEPGSVVEQNPSPDFNVKQNRIVYLTVNAQNPPKVQMPNLIDVSLRQANAMLETYDLQVGNLRYIPDFAYNAVLHQYYKGEEIKPGTLIMRKSKIDLVLGDGLKGEKILVPNLIGLTKLEAMSRLSANGLFEGALVYDNTVIDTASAHIYKQTPACREGSMINQGRTIDLFFTEDPLKLNPMEATDSIPNNE